MRCLYEVLGVERTADDDVIKKAYRKAALIWHPGAVQLWNIMHVHVQHISKCSTTRCLQQFQAVSHTAAAAATALMAVAPCACWCMDPCLQCLIFLTAAIHGWVEAACSFGFMRRQHLSAGLHVVPAHNACLLFCPVLTA